MAFNINQFRAEMKNDGARANLFEVELKFPGYVTNAVRAGETSKFMCKAAQIPESSVGIAPVNYFGREVKFAGNRTFADWTVTVLNDEDFLLRSAFERWMNGINSHAGNRRDPNALNLNSQGGNLGGYGAQAKVTHYGKLGGIAAEYTFIGMFPTNVSAIDLDWGNNDAIEEYSVTFAYQWWEAQPGDATRRIA
jgi:hypothetical protein